MSPGLPNVGIMAVNGDAVDQDTEGERLVDVSAAVPTAR